MFIVWGTGACSCALSFLRHLKFIDGICAASFSFIYNAVQIMPKMKAVLKLRSTVHCTDSPLALHTTHNADTTWNILDDVTLDDVSVLCLRKAVIFSCTRSCQNSIQRAIFIRIHKINLIVRGMRSLLLYWKLICVDFISTLSFRGKETVLLVISGSNNNNQPFRLLFWSTSASLSHHCCNALFCSGHHLI